MAVFEDSHAGVEAARCAGAAVCFALRAEHNRDVDLSKADLIVAALDDERVLSRFDRG